jgi:hypothetical protein
MISLLTAQIQVANASGKSPYESGYDHGCDDAGISDPSDRYINQPEKGPSFHTEAFMRGYNAGVDNCSDDDENTSSQDDESDESEADSARSETGNTDWRSICSTLQIALYSPCAELVNNDDGSLSSEGERALSCIRNGALLAAGAGLLPGVGIPVTPGLIIKGLDALEERTGCGGIVKMDMLNQIGNLGTILSFLP